MINMLGWRDKAYYDSDAWRGKWKTEGGGVLVNQSPHQLDLMLWYMGEVDEVYGIWKNFNHPYIEVDDTAAAIVKFKSGAIGNIIVSNSQKPGLYGKVHIHGEKHVHRFVEGYEIAHVQLHQSILGLCVFRQKYPSMIFFCLSVPVLALRQIGQDS